MNVYFINPTYVKPEGWKPLLDYLKVKAAYSFIPKDQLPNSLYSLIKPYLIASYSDQDVKSFSDNCAFWLRSHFENNIHLITSDYEDVESITLEERKKYSSQSALSNLMYLDEENCMILIKLKSYFDEDGTIRDPRFYVRELQDRNLPTHITRYCLNILHKEYGHYQYQNQSAFIVFDEFFTTAYRFAPKCQGWITYRIHLKNGKPKNFIFAVDKGINGIAPNDFPLIEVEGKVRFTHIRTNEGDEELKKLIKGAEEAEKKYEEERLDYDDGRSWKDEVDEMNRAFWEECGEAGSNCESWPGWG